MNLIKSLLAIVAAFISVTSVAAFLHDFETDSDEICNLPDSAQVARRSVACASRIPSWSYKSSINQCVQFEYNGCGGNSNRFFTLYECERACKRY
uniref:BPTI/Kunitz inhibitor domain-containing protein n=1 Tax=Glossina palpalis gambiensis TaxID=67801 RepID=A0A1B0BLN6_9MUSC